MHPFANCVASAGYIILMIIRKNGDGNGA